MWEHETIALVIISVNSWRWERSEVAAAFLALAVFAGQCYVKHLLNVLPTVALLLLLLLLMLLFFKGLLLLTILLWLLRLMLH